MNHYDWAKAIYEDAVSRISAPFPPPPECWAALSPEQQAEEVDRLRHLEPPAHFLPFPDFPPYLLQAGEDAP